MVLVTTYLAYLSITVGITVWVATTLHRSGRAFLVDAFGSNELADSINKLLVVGFYLINLGYVCYVLKLDVRPVDSASAIELLSEKLGLVLLALGCMHFFNIFLFSKFRRSALVQQLVPPATPGA